MTIRQQYIRYGYAGQISDSHPSVMAQDSIRFYQIKTIGKNKSSIYLESPRMQESTNMLHIFIEVLQF